jgi:hypothetical protein
MKRVLCLVAGLLLAAACGQDDQEIQSLVWETTGGGDLYFSIVRVNPDYQISVTRHQFAAASLTIPLTSADAAVYRLVDDIFSGHRDVRDDTVVPQGMTGSWTSITLVYADGHRDTVSNISAAGDLGQLCRFVDGRFTT